MRHASRSAAPVVVGLLALAGCALFFRSPSVRIAEVRLASLGLTSGTARVGLEVVNPNRFGLTVEGFDYRLDVETGDTSDEWRTVAEGFAPEPVELPRRDTTLVSLEIPFGYDALGAALRRVLRDGEVRYRLRGEVRVDGPTGRVNLPFDSRGAFAP